jgi:hypothetical protein
MWSGGYRRLVYNGVCGNFNLWTPSHYTGRGESVHRIELCAICDRSSCGATVIVSRLGSDKKRFDSESASIEMICPACDKPFELSITEMERVNVSDDQLQTGFFGGRRAVRAGSAGARSS